MKPQEKPFSVDFSLIDGLSQTKDSSKRYLQDMKGMYYDESAFDSALAKKNALVYEFYELGLPEAPQDLAFGTSIVYPGTVGDEFFMTKGHFHTILDMAEVYYCLQGSGYMLMENPEGDWEASELVPGKAVYVPGRYAHRSINTSDTPLITFFVFRADAGHDYGTIESKGFRKLVVKKDDGVDIIDNPRWK